MQRRHTEGRVERRTIGHDADGELVVERGVLYVRSTECLEPDKTHPCAMDVEVPCCGRSAVLLAHRRTSRHRRQSYRTRLGRLDRIQGGQ